MKKDQLKLILVFQIVKSKILKNYIYMVVRIHNQ